MKLPEILTPPPLRTAAAQNLTRRQAMNCALVNQLATPGLGSLWGRRFIAGTGQLLLACAGFVLVLVWFFKLIAGLYATGNFDFSTPAAEDPQFHAAWGWWGAGLFAASWVWSLATSISLWREADRAEKLQVQKP